MGSKPTLSGKVKRKPTDVAKKIGITPAGVQYKRDRGLTDEEIISGEGKRGANGETLAAAQLRKEQALADLRELEVQQKRGELIELKTAVLAGASMAQMTRQRMMTIPNALAGLLASTTDEREIKRLLDSEITKQLEHLSNDFLSLEDLSSGIDGDPAPAPADGDGVGREAPDR